MWNKSVKDVELFILGDIPKKERDWVIKILVELGFYVKERGTVPIKIEYFSQPRNQYNSALLLREVAKLRWSGVGLGVTKEDIYFGNLNFVFGIASPTAYASVISTFRLDPSFYGSAPDDELFFLRVKKELIHELGHIFGLPHCPDTKCVMSFSNSIQDVDFKSPNLCKHCTSFFRKSYA